MKRNANLQIGESGVFSKHNSIFGLKNAIAHCNPQQEAPNAAHPAAMLAKGWWVNSRSVAERVAQSFVK